MSETTRSPETAPRLLPMAGHTKGKRSPVTCQFKCGNACLGEICNTTDNEYFRDVATAALSRRRVLGLGAAGALVIAAGSVTGPAAAGESATALPVTGGGARWGGRPTLPFTPIDPVDATVDALAVPKGYTWSPIIRWGDPLFTDAPAFDLDRQSAAAQKRQFGYNNDYTDVIVDPRNDRSGLLVCNHEYTNPTIMFPTTTDPARQAADRAVTRAAHGMAVVELRRRRGGQPWTYVVGGRRNRRIDVDTPFAFDGPAAGSPLLRTVEHPDGRTTRGTLANCSGGTTPWGTVLSGEENVNGYFRTPGASAAEKRYGLKDAPTANGWELDEKRWDTRNAGYENAANHFGWVVEIDPEDPTSTPVKHTALGRFKHEGANIRVDREGHVVAYMGDDEKFDYLYKFVSRHRVSRNRAANLRLLSEGDLYVATFRGNSGPVDGTGTLPADGRFDGSGTWLALTLNGRSVVPGMSVEEVLVHTRLAADTLGATKMDRCEDVQPNPVTGAVYVACTNNTDRGKDGKDGKAGPDEANPRTNNRDGHVVELVETGNRADATTFRWNLLLVCGDPSVNSATYFGGYPKDRVSPISCPDNVAFDSEGNLWISTDGAPSTIGFNDGLFKVTLEGRERGRVQQFLSVPTQAETCGPVIHDRDGMVYVAVQHPGEDGSFAKQVSAFPDYVRPGSRPRRGQVAAPRPSVVQVHRR